MPKMATEVETLLVALYTATYPERGLAAFAARYIAEHQNRSSISYGHLVILQTSTGDWMIYDEDATFGERPSE